MIRLTGQLEHYFMNEHSLVTIGITAYREGDLLYRAWNSVLNQSLKDWKAVLILDGGADETTVQVFNSINHINLKKVRFDENQGPYLGRTKAIELTDTDWFYFLDGDDTLPVDGVENLIKEIDRRDVDFYYGDVRFIQQDLTEIILKRPDFDLYSILVKGDTPAVVAFKRSLFFQLKGYDKHLLRGKADFDFLLKIIDSKSRGLYYNGIVYNYHMRQDSISFSKYTTPYGFKHFVIFKNHPQIFNEKIYTSSFLTQALLTVYIYYLSNGNKFRSMVYKRRIELHVLRYLNFKWRLFLSLPLQIQVVALKLKKLLIY